MEERSLASCREKAEAVKAAPKSRPAQFAYEIERLRNRQFSTSEVCEIFQVPERLAFPTKMAEHGEECATRRDEENCDCGAVDDHYFLKKVEEDLLPLQAVTAVIEAWLIGQVTMVEMLERLHQERLRDMLHFVLYGGTSTVTATPRSHQQRQAVRIISSSRRYGKSYVAEALRSVSEARQRRATPKKTVEQSSPATPSHITPIPALPMGDKQETGYPANPGAAAPVPGSVPRQCPVCGHDPCVVVPLSLDAKMTW